jgi:aldehyde dehydrogenase (NAD+)
LLTLANRVAPALAAGCTVVLEPAEEAPLPVLCFAELALEAGLPSGVLNVVTGGWETAELIVAQRGIDKISFTGSPEAGRRIREAAAGSGKELSLELRGSHSFVVFDDADLDSAVEGVVGALWLSHGHECRSSARLLVQEGVAERVEAKLRSRVERLRLGPPLDATVDVGSIAGQAEISDSALEWTTFRTPAEALALANAAEHVRAASVWAESLELALEIARGVECEVVCLNSASMLDVGAYHEGAFGKEGVREYLEAAWRKRAVERTSHELSGGGEPRRRDEGFTGAAPHPATSEIAPASGGNRKEIHAAVSAAVAARAWSKSGGYTRSRILRRVADGLASHAEEFARLIDATREDGRGAAEVAASISRLLSYAARADIHAGTARNQSDGVVLAMAESVGVIGIACPTEAPLLALISLVVPAIVMGNATVVVPSESHPKVAMEFQSLLAEAELPAGVVSIVAGARDALAAAIAEYDAVSALWYFGSREGALAVERAAAAGMKRTWAEWARRDWLDAEQGEGREFLRHATRVKTICLPCSE